MKGWVIAVEDRPDGGKLAALLVDGRLEDLLVDPADDDAAPRPEALVWARIDRVVPAMGAAFLSLPGGQSGWLRAEDAAPGQMKLAQVARWAEPHKAAPLTDRPILKGALAMLTPAAPGVNVSRGLKGHALRERLTTLGTQGMEGADETCGLVIRTAAEDAPDAEILAEIADLRGEWDAALAAATGTAPKLLRPAPDAQARAFRDWPAPDAVEIGEDAFERLGVWDAIEALRRPRVDLPGGGWMTVEATAALVAVDVNTGDDFGKSAAANANQAACAELARQLRLRGLGGVIYMDLAPVKKGARQGVEAALKRAFAGDPVETHVAGWTPMGSVEINRRRERRPLWEVLRA
jgi:Ribonuclease G/E